MNKKLLKISETNHRNISLKAAAENRTIADVSDEIIARYFASPDGVIEEPDYKNMPIDPDILIRASRSKAKGGYLAYTEWLAMLNPREQNALKHVIKAHKSLAESVDVNRGKISF